MTIDCHNCIEYFYPEVPEKHLHIKNTLWHVSVKISNDIKLRIRILNNVLGNYCINQMCS